MSVKFTILIMLNIRIFRGELSIFISSIVFPMDQMFINTFLIFGEIVL